MQEHWLLLLLCGKVLHRVSFMHCLKTISQIRRKTLSYACWTCVLISFVKFISANAKNVAMDTTRWVTYARKIQLRTKTSKVNTRSHWSSGLSNKPTDSEQGNQFCKQEYVVFSVVHTTPCRIQECNVHLTHLPGKALLGYVSVICKVDCI